MRDESSAKLRRSDWESCLLKRLADDLPTNSDDCFSTRPSGYQRRIGLVAMACRAPCVLKRCNASHECGLIRAEEGVKLVPVGRLKFSGSSRSSASKVLDAAVRVNEGVIATVRKCGMHVTDCQPPGRVWASRSAEPRGTTKVHTPS